MGILPTGLILGVALVASLVLVFFCLVTLGFAQESARTGPNALNNIFGWLAVISALVPCLMAIAMLVWRIWGRAGYDQVGLPGWLPLPVIIVGAILFWQLVNAAQNYHRAQRGLPSIAATMDVAASKPD